MVYEALVELMEVMTILRNRSCQGERVCHRQRLILVSFREGTSFHKWDKTKLGDLCEATAFQRSVGAWMETSRRLPYRGCASTK